MRAPETNFADCGCCERWLPEDEVCYEHRFRDSRPDMPYCQECYDWGCDLETCELDLTAPVKKSQDITPAELDEVRRSLGIEP